MILHKLPFQFLCFVLKERLLPKRLVIQTFHAAGPKISKSLNFITRVGITLRKPSMSASTWCPVWVREIDVENFRIFRRRKITPLLKHSRREPSVNGLTFYSGPFFICDGVVIEHDFFCFANPL